MTLPVTLIDAVPFALLACAAAVAIAAHRGGGEHPAVDRILSNILAFFGIIDRAPLFATAIALSSAAVSGFALAFIAHGVLGRAYPWWYGLVAIATGLGIGLIAARGAAAPDTEPDDGVDADHDAAAAPEPAAGDTVADTPDPTPGDAADASATPAPPESATTPPPEPDAERE